MDDFTNTLDQRLVGDLRGMARAGKSPSEMFNSLQGALGGTPHILTLVAYFREAFALSLAEAKPFAALSRNESRGIEDKALLDELLAPEIAKHRAGWNDPAVSA